MTSISNRGLTLLILMTLALSVFTTLFSQGQVDKFNDRLNVMQTPTGFATSGTGTASINLSTDISFLLKTDTLDWGTGIVNQTDSNCASVTLTTVGTTSATLNPNNCWINNSGGSGAIEETDDFWIENIGTSTLLVTINGTNSTNFFGWGDASSTNFTWRGVETEGGSCSGSLTSTWTEFDDETAYDTLCTVLEYDNANDELYVELNLSFVRADVVGGELTGYVHFLVTNAS